MLMSIPTTSFAQEKKNQYQMIMGIDSLLNQVSNSLTVLTSDLKEVKRAVDMLTNKVGIIENDYSTFKTRDWPQSLIKLNSLDTMFTVLNTDFYNLKTISLPSISKEFEKYIVKFEYLEKKTAMSDKEAAKQDATVSITIAIAGVILTALLSLLLNRKFSQKEKENV